IRTPLASRKFEDANTKLRLFYFIFPCSSLTGVGRRIVARNGLLPPPSHLASAPAVPTPQPALTRVYAGHLVAVSRHLAPLGCIFLFSLCFFLTHFDWAGPPSRTFAATLNTTTLSPAAPRPRPRHIDMAATPLDPTDTATTTTTPPRRRHLDGLTASSSRPRCTGAVSTRPPPPPPRRRHRHCHPPRSPRPRFDRRHLDTAHLDASTITTHPFTPPRPHPTPPAPFRHGPHRHLDGGTIATHPTPTPLQPHPTGAVSTRPPPLPDSPARPPLLPRRRRRRPHPTVLIATCSTIIIYIF
ncbi:hypothetical protein EDB85DRAFT_267102, partial [Lactarius pseudohatsudake]